ncbi:PIR protein [Plasmodium vivax]|uniref:VIR protein n=1 Tax=Plasmodium vivax TaxID=5855 RepID=A0A565A638_PLAVI|nr:PIR protein [Plasmodium vivax]
MSEPNIDYYQGKDKDQIKELLKNVKLYELYNTLEQELKKIPKVETCSQRCDEKIKGDSIDIPHLRKLCIGICNIISNVKNIKGFCKGESCNGSLIYMSIWLYERVSKITSSESEINKFYAALYSIMKTNAPKLNEYYITNYNNYKDVFKDMKYLCEFLHIYDDIQKEISTNISAKNQLYCRYIQEFFKYYNTIEGSCITVRKKKPIYCGVIDKYHSTLIKTGTLGIIYNNCNFDEIPCEPHTSVKTIFPCLKMNESLFKKELQSDYIKNIVSTLYSAILPFISILGILLIFYKFTPLGSYLRTRMRRKKNIKTNTHEEKYNNLENISTIQENNAHNLRYNIMYQ